MSDPSDNKIMGFIPKSRYVQITYYLLLAAVVGGLVLSLLAMIGVIIPLGGLFNLAGLIGLVMALLGFFVFKAEFSALDQSHLLYISVVIGAFIIIGIVIGASLFAAPMLAYMVTFLLACAQVLMVYTGYNSWKRGRSITKENIKDEVQLAMKRA
jgi:hypothetical protein